MRRAAATPVRFAAGALYVLRGARYVYLARPGLVRFWGVPVLLTVAAFVGAGWAAFEWADDVAGWVATPPDPGAEGVWDTVLGWLHGALEVLAGVLVFAVGVAAIAVALPLLLAPFNDALSEAVERGETGVSGPPFRLGKIPRDVARSLGYELAKLLAWFVVVLPLLVSSLFVGPLGPVAGALGFALTCLTLGLDAADWPAGRRDRTLSDRGRFLRAHWPAVLGLGVGVWALLLVPFVHVLFMPAAVAGGTLLYLDLEGPADAGEGAGAPPTGGGRPP